MIRKTTLALLCAMALPAAPVLAQTGDMTPPPPPTTAPDYINQAGAGDMFEIQSSKLVLGSTHDAKIRSFANKMIADHNKSTAMVKAAARKDHEMVAPPVLTPMQQDMITRLHSAMGKDRDTLYLQEQAQSHQMALQVQQTYASSGDKPALKAAAAKIVPVVQMHIDMLNKMGATGSTM